MREFVTAAMKNDFKEGQGKVVEIKGKKIALFLHEGKFYAIDNACKHMGGPLGEGELENENIVCPWHGWKFSIKTGVSPVNPTVKVEIYNVKIEDNEIKIEV
ncbi:Rieske (2Fe-2S) protein [Candidatus Woesearchaeota archaeon]|nr:Rieske (2Fe-2S) protein [Candidatus Woesearchaeota archaeon]